MDRWICKPLISVGPVRFGMAREIVRGLFTLEQERRQTGFSRNTYDDFGGFHVFYAADGTVEAVEVLYGIEIELYGKVIFPTDVGDIIPYISGFQKKAGNYIQPDLSIGLYAIDGEMYSILFGKQGYFISSKMG